MATYNQGWPTTADNYQTAFVPRIQDNFLALGKMMEGDTVSAPVTGLKRYNLTSRRFERYTGSAWASMDLTGQYASDKLVVGHTSNPDIAGGTSALIGLAADPYALSAASYHATANPTVVSVARSRNATVGSHTLLGSGDGIMSLRGLGSDGTSFARAAQIDIQTDAAPAAGSMPGRLMFSVTPSGSTTPVEAMRIASTGAVGIGTSSLSASYKLRVGGTMSNPGSNLIAVSANPAVAAGSTNSLYLFHTAPTSVAGSTSLAGCSHFYANGLALATGVTLTNQYGFYAHSSINTATNNYGFYSELATAAGRWNFYAVGTAPNFFAGGLYINTAQTYTLNGIDPMLAVSGNGGGNSSMANVRFSDNGNAAGHHFGKARGTPSAPTSVVAGDNLGSLWFNGHNGTSFAAAAHITAVVDGTPSSTSMPGAIVFNTTPVGSTTSSEAARIKPNNDFISQGLLFGRGGGAGLGQITVSTATPSGGADGDMWFQY